MEMEQYADNNTVHFFDEIPGTINPIVYANNSSIKTGKNWGELYSTSEYNGTPYSSTSSWYTPPSYAANNGNLVYENGALKLGGDNAIPVLEINQKYRIGDEYTISITVKGDITQFGHASTASECPIGICAISGDESNYCSWIGFYRGYLQIYSYYQGSPKWNTKRETNEDEYDGFASIKIPDTYNNEIMNIQVSAKRNNDTTEEKERTEVYINGNLVADFPSGQASLDYKYLTVGDLRVGRGLKFEGNVYEFAIYGVYLEKDLIEQHFDAVKQSIPNW